jgi:hypothetical protein
MESLAEDTIITNRIGSPRSVALWLVASQNKNRPGVGPD